MTEYVLQVRTSDNYLAKCYEVTEEDPTPTSIPTGRVQLITTDTTLYDDAVAFYNANTVNSEYFLVNDVLTWQLRT